MNARRPEPREPGLPVISFVDLDDTLFRSPARGGHGRPVTVTRQGRPYSYMSAAQARFFGLLRDAGRVIPTTARVPEQLDRVQLPFDDHAICANGAVILDPHGTPDPAWHARVEARWAALEYDADEVADRATRSPGGDALRVRTVTACDRPFMVDVRHPDRESEPMARWSAAFQPHLPAGWRLDVARDRALIYPAAIDKAAAVEWFIEHHVEQPALVLGAGDRHSDADFMAHAHFALMPTHAVLFDTLSSRDTP